MSDLEVIDQVQVHTLEVGDTFSINENMPYTVKEIFDQGNDIWLTVTDQYGDDDDVMYDAFLEVNLMGYAVEEVFI